MKKTLLFLVLIALSFTSLAEIEQSDRVDKIFSEWDKANTPGAALGIVQDGKLIYAKGYGMANLEYSLPNTPTSVFRIGSTSKQFTAACIVLLAEQGKLSLDDPLTSHFPDFPEYAEQITIQHLLNHTSGIRDYLVLAYLKGIPEDGYYLDSDIMQWLLAQTELNFAPGDEYLYSNSGYWLLGQIVGKVAQMNMADFAEKEIFAPLNMNDTHFHNDHTQIVKNRASGYSPSDDDGYQISMTTLDMIGDGGIFITIEDMKKWDDAYYSSTVLSKTFWQKMTRQGVLNDGEQISYASGLNISSHNGLKTISHGGAFVGFRADSIRFPEQKFSVFVFANRADANPTHMAYQVADIFLEGEYIVETTPTEPDEKKQTGSTPLSLEQIAGNYELRPGMSTLFSAENGVLNAVQSWNGSSYTLTESKDHVFHMSGRDNIDLIFSDLVDGQAKQVTVIQNGRERIWKRTQVMDASKVNLQDYVGAFYSQELDTTCTIKLNDGKLNDSQLSVSFGSNDAFSLALYAEDQFTSEGRVFRYQRTAGNITHFKLDAGRVKNLKFVKK